MTGKGSIFRWKTTINVSSFFSKFCSHMKSTNGSKEKHKMPPKIRHMFVTYRVCVCVCATYRIWQHDY